MRILAVLTYLVCFYISTCQAQGESNIWYIGGSPGFTTTFDFNGSIVPAYVTNYSGSANGGKGNSVCDAMGQLLFYTNGRNVWNRNHQLMPNGIMHQIEITTPINIAGVDFPSETLITSVPGQPGKYYIFYSIGGSRINEGSNSSYCYYSMVDMSLDNGLGDVVAGQKHQLLVSESTYTMAATAGDQCDLWLVIAPIARYQPKTLPYMVYKAFHITAKGVDTTAITSMGTMPRPTQPIQSKNSTWINKIRFSPNGQRMAAAYSAITVEGIELMDFDKATGVLSNSKIIGSNLNAGSHVIPNAYRTVCFSPDNTKLYGGAVKEGAVIMQYDLNAGTAASIHASRTVMYGYPSGIIGGFDWGFGIFSGVGDSKISPDGRIYFTVTGVASPLRIINFPNLAGTAAGVGPGVTIPQPPPGYGYGDLTPFPTDNVILPPLDTNYNYSLDTLVCTANGQFRGINIALPPGALECTWNDGDTDTVRVITQPGKYWVIARYPCKVMIDTFLFRQVDVALDLGPDTALCDQSELMLAAAEPGVSKLWQDGSRGDSFKATQSGIYWVRVEKKGCEVSDTVHLKLGDYRQHLGNDTVVCEGASVRIRLDAQVPYGAEVTWSDGSHDASIMVQDTGRYWVTVADLPCQGSDTINVLLKPGDFRQSLGADTVLCAGMPVELQLEAHVPEGASVTWSGVSNGGASVTIRDTGTYWVRVSDLPCWGSDTIRISSEVCDCLFNMPSAFSPNGDGRNDVFRPVLGSSCVVTGYFLNVYNRYGQRIYNGMNVTEGWDGSFKGTPADVGTYHFDVGFTGAGDRHYQQKGDVTLIR